MKKLAVIPSMIFALALIGCSSSTTSSALNGNWSASLINSSSVSSNLAFTVTLSSDSGGNVTGSSLTFTTPTSCFSSTSTVTGSFTDTSANGTNSGSLQMTIQSGSGTSGNNSLNLSGTLSNSTITGNWSLSGSTVGCGSSGTFTMNKM
jgi:hypothetical protein